MLVALGIHINTRCFLALCVIVYVSLIHTADVTDVLHRTTGAISARVVDAAPRVTKNPRFSHKTSISGGATPVKEHATKDVSEKESGDLSPDASSQMIVFETLPHADFYKEEALQERRETFSNRPNVPTRQESSSRARFLDSMYKELSETNSRDPYMRPVGEPECQQLRGHRPEPRTW